VGRALTMIDLEYGIRFSPAAQVRAGNSMMVCSDADDPTKNVRIVLCQCPRALVVVQQSITQV
jgi:hypothetical protein